MGKSNSLNIINKLANNKKDIFNILNIDEIKILEKINKKFINEVIIYFSKFIKNNVKLNFFSIEVNSCTDNDKYIKYLFSNKIELLNSKKQSFLFFSDNLLSVFIDLLFGGKGTCTEKITKERNITYTEKIIGQKVLKLIFNVYFKSFQKLFSINTNTINMKMIDIKKFSFSKEKFITNYFSLSVNGINIFLSILFPLEIVKKYFQKTISLEKDKKSLIKNINLKKNIPISNPNDVELDVVVKLIMSSEEDYSSLSIGDILTIKNPEKVITYIEKKPIFLGHYKNFNKKSVIFLKKFIHKNLDLHKYEDFYNE